MNPVQLWREKGLRAQAASRPRERSVTEIFQCDCQKGVLCPLPGPKVLRERNKKSFLAKCCACRPSFSSQALSRTAQCVMSRPPSLAFVVCSFILLSPLYSSAPPLCSQHVYTLPPSQKKKKNSGKAFPELTVVYSNSLLWLIEMRTTEAAAVAD